MVKLIIVYISLVKPGVMSVECKDLYLIAHGLLVAHSLTHQPDQTDLSLRDK